MILICLFPNTFSVIQDMSGAEEDKSVPAPPSETVASSSTQESFDSGVSTLDSPGLKDCVEKIFFSSVADSDSEGSTESGQQNEINFPQESRSANTKSIPNPKTANHLEAATHCIHCGNTASKVTEDSDWSDSELSAFGLDAANTEHLSACVPVPQSNSVHRTSCQHDIDCRSEHLTARNSNDKTESEYENGETSRQYYERKSGHDTESCDDRFTSKEVMDFMHAAEKGDIAQLNRFLDYGMNIEVMYGFHYQSIVILLLVCIL